MAEEAEIEYTEIEQKAIEKGWKPEGVEGREFVSAEGFLERYPLMQEIYSLRKQMRKEKERTDAMAGMIEGVRKQGYEKAIQELNEQKKRAMEEENYDGVIKIDEQIAQKKEEAKSAPEANPDFEEWIEGNSWYEENDEMKEYADFVGAKYHESNKNKPLKDVYKHVSEKVRKQYPDFFDPEPRKNAVEGASHGRSGGKVYSSRDLTETERQIMKTLIRSGDFKNEAEFMKKYHEG